MGLYVPYFIYEEIEEGLQYSLKHQSGIVDLTQWRAWLASPKKLSK